MPVAEPHTPRIIVPPFTIETAVQRVGMAEDVWNSRDPERVVLAYTEDSVWRNRDVFPVGREQISAFLRGKWDRELDYRLVKELWAFQENRIAVRFQYEWHTAAGDWFRSYGNELWEFDERADAPPRCEHQRPPDPVRGPEVLLARARPAPG